MKGRTIMEKSLKTIISLLVTIALVITPISYTNAETRNNNPLLREILINGETSCTRSRRGRIRD